MKNILLVFGTRPEAIKMAPLAKTLLARGDARCRVCVTAQHRQMLDQVLGFFDLRPDIDLDLMQAGQGLSELTARILVSLDPVLRAERPDWLVVQGDTTTSMAASLAGFHLGIPVAHVEAGLRTANKRAPFPEECNRRITSVLADLHFAPTEANRHVLLREGVEPGAAHVTGNTVIDALLWARDQVSGHCPEGLRDFFGRIGGARMLLVTGHRRESFGGGFEEICQALLDLASAYPDLAIAYPVHLNPHVQEPVRRLLGAARNIHLLPPQPYPDFVYLMHRSHLILTDSGGVQEEAPSLGKPVLVMRDSTERQEGIAAGNALLVGPRRDRIVRETARLLEAPAAYRAMSESINPYGDGRASERIAALLLA